jgi:hypothetical protein
MTPFSARAGPFLRGPSHEHVRRRAHCNLSGWLPCLAAPLGSAVDDASSQQMPSDFLCGRALPPGKIYDLASERDFNFAKIPARSTFGFKIFCMLFFDHCFCLQTLARFSSYILSK